MSTDKNRQQENEKPRHGVVTVNDERNPTPQERDAKIPHEADTERLRSERQSVRDADAKGESA